MMSKENVTRPLISVFIPSYNMAAFLPQAIVSVLAQSYPHYELIIINDGSTDETATILQPYYHDARITIQNNPRNLGMAATWNVGLQLCRGEFIVKLDADDYYEPDYLHHIVATFQQSNDIGLVFSGVKLIYPDGRVEPEVPFVRSWVRSRAEFLPILLRLCVIRSPSACVRRDCYELLGRFTSAMKIHTDWEMWVRIAARYQVGFVNLPLANYRVSYGANCTAQAAIDGRSMADLRLWLDLLAHDALPYRLTAIEEAIFRRGMAELEMHFAGVAAYYHHDEAMQQAYATFAAEILPEMAENRQLYLYLQQGICAFREQQFLEARHFFWQAIKLNPAACAIPWIWSKLLLTFVGRTKWGLWYK
jgi:glycosyltransferase involved in cell wall biosynthesis